MIISKEQYMSVLIDRAALNKNQLEILRVVYDNMFTEVHNRDIGKRIGQKFGTVNLRFGRLGRAFAYKLDIEPAKRKNGSFEWWQILADKKIKDGKTYWMLKKNLIDALTESALFSDVEIYPDEINPQKIPFYEGGYRKVYVNAFERNRPARDACLNYYGAVCQVCNIDFKKMYGDIGEGFMHVHHLEKIAEKGKERYQINPIKDLIPLCPNCHSMIHKREEPYSVRELKEKIAFVHTL